MGKHLEPIEEQKSKQKQIRKPIVSVPLNLGGQKDKHKKETDTKVAKQLGISGLKFVKLQTCFKQF